MPSRHLMEVNGQFHYPAALPSWNIVLGTHWIGIWVGHRARLNTVEERKITSPCRESNHDSSISQPLAQYLYPLRYPGPSLGEQKFLLLYVTFVVRRF